MHVLIIPSWYPEDVNDIRGVFFREQALAISRYGIRTGVIYPQLRSPLDWKSIFKGPYGEDRSNDEKVHTYRRHGMAWLPLMPYFNNMLWVWHGLGLFKSYSSRHGMPDVLHAHSLLNAGLLAQAIHDQYQIPYVITEHSSVYASGCIKKWHVKLARRAAEEAQYRLAVSRFLSESLNLLLRGSRGWRYLPNILPAHFENIEIKTKKDSSTFTFCNISLLTANKGIDVLLSAFAKAFSGNRSIRLKIGGDGFLRNDLETMAESLQVQEQVDFLGLLNREQVADLLQNSQAYVLSSHIETFGISAIEALSMGIPVIATRCGGPESIIRPEDGFLIAKNDISAMAGAMQQLYKGYNDFNPWEIRQACLRRYSAETVVGKLSCIYQELAEKDTPPNDNEEKMVI